jgi:CrcB protein
MLGGSARWLVGVLFHVELGVGFPLATLLVNLLGSFVIGVYAALVGPDGRLLASPRQRHFVMTGICGGFTTFSIFSLETVRLIEGGRLDLAGANITVSLGAWLLAVWAGYALGARLNRLRRR